MNPFEKGFKKHSTLRSGLAGAAIGGIAGAGLGYAGADKKHEWGDTLTGAALGAATGGLFGHAAGNVHKIKSDFQNEFNRSRNAHRKAWEEAGKKQQDDFKNHWDDFFKNRGGAGGGGQRQNYGGGGQRKNYGGFGGSFGSIDDHLKDFGMAKEHATSKQAIKKHFRAQAMKHHPDRGGDKAMFQKINNAHDNIKNSKWYNDLPDDDFTKKAFFRSFQRRVDYV